MAPNLPLSGARLWDSLMEMAKIGPGVVPFGVDPAYDAQYKLNQAPRSHVASHGQGKPFTVEPGPHQRTQ